MTTPAERSPALPASDSLRSGSVLLFGVWSGLLLGLGESTLLGLHELIRPRLQFVGGDTYWLAPIAEALTFAILALLLLVPARRWPWLRSWPALVTVFFFLGLATLLLTEVHGLHPLALLLVAAGVASQVGPRFPRWFPGFPRLVRRSFPILLIVVLSVVIVVRGRPWWRERQADHRASARTTATNVLLLILDTVRAQDLELYGYPRPTTPNLVRWSREGVRVEHAWSTASWTLYSHASIFTGRLPRETSARWLQPLDATWPTLAEQFDSAGYRTGGFVANLEYCNVESGLARGFRHYEDYPLNLGQLVLSSGLLRRLTNAAWVRKLAGSEQRLNRKSAESINASLLGWLDRAPGRPFFAFLNYYDAHTPYYPPREFASRFQTPGIALNRAPDRDLPPARGQFSRAEIQGGRDAYDAAIAYLDDQIGTLLDALDRRGLLDRTLVVITADHGEEFNEHGFTGHGNTLYREVLEVPLLLIQRGRLPKGASVAGPVSLLHLGATILDLAGPGRVPAFPGRSLAPLLAGTDSARVDTLVSELGRTPGKPDWLPSSRGDMTSLLYQRLHYIVNGDGSEELYDYLGDPSEQRDLVRDSSVAAPLATLRTIASRLAPGGAR